MTPRTLPIATWRAVSIRLPPEGPHTASLACRVLARRLLVEAGAATCEVGRGARGEPLWPRGFVGSIAHARSLGVVALARTAECSALGVDVEEIVALEDGLLDVVADPCERAFVLAAQGVRRDRRARLLFTAKEAFFKALPGAAQDGLEPRDLRVRCAPSGRAFSARLASWPTDAALHGRATVFRGCMIAVVHRPSRVDPSSGAVP